MLLADFKKSDCYNERLKKMSINMAMMILMLTTQCLEEDQGRESRVPWILLQEI